MKAGTKYSLPIAILTAMLCMSVHAEGPPALQVQTKSFRATEGIPFYNVKVANFTDPALSVPGDLIGPVYEVTNYSATITWGDGTGPYPATLSVGLNGVDVLGTHTYTEHGPYTLLVQVTKIDGAAGSGDLAVTVSDARLLAAHPTLLSAVELVPFTNVVATFEDENPYGVIEDFSATIDWGDGSPSSDGIIVTNEAGGFQVVGTHTYPKERLLFYAYTVKISDVGGGSTYALGAVCVADAPLIPAGIDISVTEGAQFDGIVATFTHANTNEPQGDFAAVITWGDDPEALPLAGDVRPYGPPGSFAVYGAHIYTNASSYPIGIDITSKGGSTAHAGATAIVGDAEIKALASPISGIEGLPIQFVANFTDENPYATTDDFTATINWGDGTAEDTGAISGDAINGFTVGGTHVYLDEQDSYRITVAINDKHGATAGCATQATISDAALSLTDIPTLSLVEGAPFTGTIATVTDANPYSTADELMAIIEWGDGVSSTGQLQKVTVKNGAVLGVSYSVLASHVYTNWNSYTFRISVTDMGGSFVSGTGKADVLDAPITSIGRVITPTEGTSFYAVVASFTDENPYGTTNQFDASLDWGDGTASTGGTILANTNVNTGKAEFVVMGSHQYANQGLFPVHVRIQSDGGQQTIASSASVTADAPMIGYGTTITAVKSVSFSNVVANCVDTDTTPEPETTYECIIDWGDGTTTATPDAKVTEGEDGSYAVSAAHTYAQPGSYVILATIDNQQTFVSTTARSAAIVNDTPAKDVTSQFILKTNRLTYNKHTGLYKQVMTIKNPSSQPIGGPVCIVLDNLSNGTLYNKDGVTTSAGAAPLGSPYKNVALPKKNIFQGRNTKSVTLYFSSSPGNITYKPRVLAGPGAR